MDSDAGNQSDSSGNSNSSLASSTKYNERYPRPVVGKGGRSCGSCGTTASRGSFAKLGSRTSLPPLNENCLLDATESQLALNLRRATRSTSWTNQKILDAIDGLNTCEKELDPCLALGVAAGAGGGGSNARKDSPRSSFEKFFVVPKSISNLIMQSRSSGSVNPTSGQKGENSCYNFLCGITEDEDEEQDDCNNKHSSSGAGASFRLPVSPASLPVDEKRKHVVAGGETVEGDPLSADDNQVDGAHVDFPRRSRNGTAAISMKKVMIQENDLCSDRVISIRSEMDSNLCNMSFDKQHNNAHNSLYGTAKKERPSAYQNLHNVRFEDDDEVPTQ
ncbi:hypothetical protein Ocin01_10581 [Orchesella cincta]|uniref:Uncharacterized protein n=1 Tax=Orchesella cincta TaxID=48709 RepID=A0A1D2MSK4_ORCCI|nr:hypothetical protein Ocin01_10581 [Orchesella cincta]